MVIFGVALLAMCMLTGLFFGEMLGVLLGIEANVGGVGLAMIMLVLIVDYLKKRGKLSQPAQEGLGFWSAMYIPIVIAMSANQNVAAALDGGPLAVVAGVAAVVISWMLVPLLSKGAPPIPVEEEKENPVLAGGESNVSNVK
ncbi:malonate transporter subunit MadL [Domibacillus sp. PGB-M46]|uniref:malonate transporter subunit MadL n=1 Tax=Domibacillus sp. PGB-M46 TaxID=2910255 RepID=UPI001F5637C7|nr:malonate transporter subunit MadL [Domibacillus sp. PGB-M46]MCI2257040.1 malonate transporter subunit MadL [Domibacillus sp. PGB-M46]